MAYILRDPDSDSSFLSRLNLNMDRLPLGQVSGGFAVDDNIRQSWSRLENTLLHVSNILLEVTVRLPESRFPLDPFWPLPQECGYLHVHRNMYAAKRALYRSRDAFFLLAARCSLAIALTHLLEWPYPDSSSNWERILLKADICPTWIDLFRASAISDMSPGLRAGAFISTMSGDNAMQWINHVPCMVKANLPVYIY